jgi:hypothetical protein
MKITLILFLLLGVRQVFAQNVKEVVAQMQQVYTQAESIEYKSKYELFKGAGSQPVSMYEGYVYRKGKSLYQKIDHSEYIYGADFFLKIDHEEELLELENAQQILATAIDLESALKACSTAEISEEGASYVVRLSYNPGTQLPFSSVVIRIAKKSYMLLELDLYYAAAQDFSATIRQQELDFAHLRITFSELQLHPKPQDALLALSSYIETSAGAQVPKVPFATYELKDNRLK